MKRRGKGDSSGGTLVAAFNIQHLFITSSAGGSAFATIGPCHASWCTLHKITNIMTTTSTSSPPTTLTS
jgi:hypothetical protein